MKPATLSTSEDHAYHNESDVKPATLSTHEDRACKKSDVTSAALSTYDVLNKPKLGEFLRIRIQAVSVTHCLQRDGGDFWFAMLTTLNTTGSTSSQVVDHQNGTYSVDLFVGWKGYVAVDIILVHPSAATRFLHRVMNISDYSRLYWTGLFTPARNVTSLCYMRYQGPKSWKNRCAYTNERALGKDTAWVCNKPGYGVSCDKIDAFTTHKIMIKRTFKKLSKASGMLFNQ